MLFRACFAADSSKDAYPLTSQGALQWQSTEFGFCANLALPDIPEGHIVVPSFACLNLEYEFQFVLHHGQHAHRLQPVPCEAGCTLAMAQDQSISRHIDCWHSHQQVSNASLVLQVRSHRMPLDYLALVTIRPLEVALPTPPNRTVTLSEPTPYSQMEAAQDIRQRICSPTALTMALDTSDSTIWADTISACYDPNTKAYGVWPLAIHWAARRGHVAAVETFVDWDAPLKVLSSGARLVCSIDFAEGGLPGAPLRRTGGHLVTLYGVDQQHALVMDPAAPTKQQVPHRYPIAAFSQAWLTRRGAAYVIGATTCA